MILPEDINRGLTGLFYGDLYFCKSGATPLESEIKRSENGCNYGKL